MKKSDFCVVFDLDDTLFAMSSGKVKFGSRRGRKLVGVLE